MIRSTPLKNTMKKTVTQLAVLALVSTAVIGCNRGIKPEVNEPSALIEIAQPIRVLTPVFDVDMGSSRSTNNDPLSLRPGIDTAQNRTQIVTASRGGDLAGFDQTGQRLWSINVDDEITGGVAVDAATQTAIISTRNGQIIAVDSVTGETRWRHQLSGSVLSPALISNNRVILLANDGMIYGLSLQSGQSVWSFVTPVPSISVRGSAAPAMLDDTTVVVATADGRLHALTIDSGLPLWSRRVGAGIGASEVERMSDVDGMPIVDNDQLFAISYSGQLVAIDLRSKQVMYINDVASLKSLAVNNQQVIATSLSGNVIAYDRGNGETLWENSELAYRQLTNPVMIGNYIAVGDIDGVVHLLNAQTGAIVSRVQTQGSLSTLQSKAGRLSAQSDRGRVTIWRLAQ